MTNAELILKVAADAKIKKAHALRAIKSMVDAVRTSIQEGKKITIAGLGTFKVKTARPRKGRNPKTGASIEIPARKKVSFRLASSLKKALKQ